MHIFLYIVIIVTFLDTFIQLPIISTYSQQIGASSMLTGMIISIYSLSNMIGNAISGYYIDRYGRKKLLLFGMFFVTIILLIYPLAKTGESLFFVRLIHGFFGGAMIPAAFAYLSDVSPRKRQGRTMAYSGASIGTAAIIGPALGGIIAANHSIEMVFYFVAILFTITSIAVVFKLKESHKGTKKDIESSSFKQLLIKPMLLQAIISAFALMASMGTLTYTLPLKMAMLSYSPTITGLLISSFGIVAIIIFITPLNRIFDKYEAQKIIISGMIFIGIALLLLGTTNSLVIISFSMLLYGLGFSFIFPSMNKLVVTISTQSNRGRAFGLFYGGFSLGVVFGSLFSGSISELNGNPLIVTSIFMVFMIIVFWGFVHRNIVNLKTR